MVQQHEAFRKGDGTRLEHKWDSPAIRDLNDIQYKVCAWSSMHKKKDSRCLICSIYNDLCKLAMRVFFNHATLCRELVQHVYSTSR